MSPQFTAAQIRDMIERCINEGRKLTDWERLEFLPSVLEQMDRIGKLSPKQTEILERIYIERVP